MKLLNVPVATELRDFTTAVKKTIFKVSSLSRDLQDLYCHA
jgi:hypothetical protein